MVSAQPPWRLPSRERSRYHDSAMFDVHLLCYPWDVSESRADAVLDRVRGEIGATGLTVVAATRPVCQLRRRPGAVQPPPGAGATRVIYRISPPIDHPRRSMGRNAHDRRGKENGLQTTDIEKPLLSC